MSIAQGLHQKSGKGTTLKKVSPRQKNPEHESFKLELFIMSHIPNPSLELLLRESHELHRAAIQLRSSIHSHQCTKQEVAEMVRQLSDAVENHFALEEEGGYLQDVVQRIPHMDERVRRLQEQHEELLETIQRLSMLATSGVESETWWTRISQDAESFVNRLIDHEHAENELVQEAYTEDIGTKD